MTPTTTPTAAEELRELLKEAIELLNDSAQLPFKDTAHHERVKRLGEEIGFGAMMHCATLGWREANAEQGYPVGGEFTVGHTRIVVEKFVGRAKAALQAPTLPVPVREIEEALEAAGFLSELPFHPVKSADELRLDVPNVVGQVNALLKLLNAWPALRQLPAGAWSGWRDISSAPRDGTWIELYRPKAFLGTHAPIVIGLWHEFMDEADSSGSWTWPSGIYDAINDPDGALSQIEDDLEYWYSEEFTHWRPITLPDAPNPEAKVSDNGN